MSKCFTQKTEYKYPKLTFYLYPTGMVVTKPGVTLPGFKSAARWLWDLGQVTLQLCTSVFSPIKWRQYYQPQGLLWGLNQVIHVKCLEHIEGTYRHYMYLLLSALGVKLTAKVATSALPLELCIQQPPLGVLSRPPRHEALQDVSPRLGSSTEIGLSKLQCFLGCSAEPAFSLVKIP